MAWGGRATDADYQQKRESASSSGKLFRFYLKAGERKKILFLGDERFVVYEHMEKIGDMWEKFTCSEDSNCYFCGLRKSRTFTEYSTILDLTPYLTKAGEKRKYSRRLFGATGAAIDILDRRRQEKGGSLAGYGVECVKDEGKTPPVGNDFNVSAEKFDPKKLYPEAKEFDFKLFDFRKVLAPLSSDQILSILRFNNASVGIQRKSDLDNPDMGMEHANEDIPF